MQLIRNLWLRNGVGREAAVGKGMLPHYHSVETALVVSGWLIALDFPPNMGSRCRCQGPLPGASNMDMAPSTRGEPATKAFTWKSMETSWIRNPWKKIRCRYSISRRSATTLIRLDVAVSPAWSRATPRWRFELVNAAGHGAKGAPSVGVAGCGGASWCRKVN